MYQLINQLCKDVQDDLNLTGGKNKVQFVLTGGSAEGYGKTMSAKIVINGNTVLRESLKYDKEPDSEMESKVSKKLLSSIFTYGVSTAKNLISV